MKAGLDPLSSFHVRSFRRGVLILAAFNLPLVFSASFEMETFLSRMRLAFALVGWAAAVIAVRQRQPFMAPSLNLWDEAAGFLALGLGCSLALGLGW